MKPIDRWHERRQAAGGAAVFAALSVLVLGCGKSEKGGTPGDSVPPPVGSEAPAMPGPGTDRPTPPPEPSEFTGHPRPADVDGIRRYTARLEWRLSAEAEIDVGGGQRARVKLESERGAYNINEAGYRRGRIIARISHVSGAPWLRFGLRRGGTVYWWAEGEFPATFPIPGTVITVSQSKALYIDLEAPSAWKSYDLLYHHHGVAMYPDSGASGKFKKLKKTKEGYELVQQDGAGTTRGDVAGRRRSLFSLTSLDWEAPAETPASLLQTEIDVMWEACIRGCCAPRAFQ